MKLVARADGLFGPLEVYDAYVEAGAAERALFLGEQYQGGSLLYPPGVVDGREVRPGPVAALPYAGAWLLAMAPPGRTRALMVGLGSGAGAVALLAQRPDVRVVAVEIDPEVVRLARACYPLVDALAREGRLALVTAEAAAWAARAADRGERFDACLADAYADGDETWAPEPLLAALGRLSPALWLNVLDDARRARLARVAATLTALGHPPRAALDAAPDRPAEALRNLVLTTDALTPAEAAAVPFWPALRHPVVRAARARHEAMVASLGPAPAAPGGG